MKNIFSIRYEFFEIKKAVIDFWQQAKGFRIIAFRGEMGAGKTTFIHALCDFLKVKDVVSSPTFALINEYRFDDDGEEKLIYHMDWYRINSDEEAMQAGMEDAVMKENAYCFIEWAEKAQRLLPLPYLNISIKVLSDDEREIVCNVVERVR